MCFFITVIIANLVHYNDMWFNSALQSLIHPKAYTYNTQLFDRTNTLNK